MLKLDEAGLICSMIAYYCSKKHNTGGPLCSACESLLEYSRKRLVKCPQKKRKPVCSNCKIHCYKPEMRKEIKKVMGFSGPKILFLDPLGGIKYLLKKILHR